MQNEEGQKMDVEEEDKKKEKKNAWAKRNEQA